MLKLQPKTPNKKQQMKHYSNREFIGLTSHACRCGTKKFCSFFVVSLVLFSLVVLVGPTYVTSFSLGFQLDFFTRAPMWLLLHAGVMELFSLVVVWMAPM